MFLLLNTQLRSLSKEVLKHDKLHYPTQTRRILSWDKHTENSLQGELCLCDGPRMKYIKYDLGHRQSSA